MKRVAVLLLLCLVGCRQQMASQPYYRPLDPSEFFADGMSARPLVPGTVARGELRLDTDFYTGLEKSAVRPAGDVSAGPGRVPGEAAVDKPGGAASEGKQIQPASQRVAPAAVQSGAEVALTVARDDLAKRPYVREFPIAVNRDAVARGQSLFTAFCGPCHDAAGTGNGVVVQRGFTAPPTIHSDRLRSAPPGYFFDVISRGYGSMPSYAEQIQPADRWAIVTYVRALQLAGPPKNVAAVSETSEGHRATR